MQETLTKTITKAAKPAQIHPEELTEAAARPQSAPSSSSAAINYAAAAADNLTLDLEKLLNTLSSICNEKIVSEIGYVYQINCVGYGEFYMDLKNGAGWIEMGPTPPTISPDINIELNSEDLLGLVLGLMSPWEAYRSGRVNITGNVQAATKLQVLSKVLNQQLSGKRNVQLL